jgi:hypothetical protein
MEPETRVRMTVRRQSPLAAVPWGGPRVPGGVDSPWREHHRTYSIRRLDRPLR